MPDSPKIIYSISGITDGNMRLGGKGVPANRQKFLAKHGISPGQIVAAQLEHSDKVAVVGREYAGHTLSGIDGIVTNSRNLFLTVTVADCMPVYFYDYSARAVGLAHVGWRGLKAGLLGKMWATLSARYKVQPKDLRVYFGPHIRDCHFEVQDDVIAYFQKIPDAVSSESGRRFLNLEKAAKFILTRYGVEKKNIESDPHCTYCHNDKYFSFRRDRPEEIQAMMAYIGMR